jgi:AcrR family transcriptional regulator
MRLGLEGNTLRSRFDDNRRQELLDGVMGIITVSGFAGVTISEMARQLHCSASSLYRIASSKDSLVVIAITHWGDRVLKEMEDRAHRGRTAVDKARLYLQAGAETVRSQSHEFRIDVDRFDSARMAYAIVSNRFIDRFVELLDDAVEAGEIEPANTRFLAHLFQQMAFVVRDEDLLNNSGITASDALIEIDRIIWDGIRLKGSRGGGRVQSRTSRKRGVVP